MDTASSANLQEGNSTLNVERSNVEEEVVSELERDENGRSGESSDFSVASHPEAAGPSTMGTNGFEDESSSSFIAEERSVDAEVLSSLEERIVQLERNSEASIEHSNMEAQVLCDLKARIVQLEQNSAAVVEYSNAEAATPSSTKGATIPPKKQPKNRDFSEALSFKKFHPNKLQKSEQIAVDHDMKNFSMYDIFHDIVLQPYMPLESVTSCFVKQFCAKLYSAEIITLLITHFLNSCEGCAFPLLVELIASAIISGYGFEEQLHHNDFMIKELKTILQKQLNRNFEELFSTAVP